MLASTHSVPQSRGTDSGPSLGPRCEPKPVRFLMRTGSGMMVSGAPAARKTSIVSASTKRHGLCQRRGVVPDRGNRTFDLRALCTLRPLQRGEQGRGSICNDLAVRIRVCVAKPDRPGLRLLGPKSPPLPGALRGGRALGFWAEAGMARGPPFRRRETEGTGSNDSAPENERDHQPGDCRKLGLSEKAIRKRLRRVGWQPQTAPPARVSCSSRTLPAMVRPHRRFVRAQSTFPKPHQQRRSNNALSS